MSSAEGKPAKQENHTSLAGPCHEKKKKNKLARRPAPTATLKPKTRAHPPFIVTLLLPLFSFPLAPRPRPWPPLPRPGRRVFPVGAVPSGPAPHAGAPAGPPARPKETRKAGTTESTRAREKTGQPRRKPGGRGRGGTKNRPRHGRPCRQTSHTAHPPPTPSAFFFKRV